MIKFIDSEGLKVIWEKIKAYIDGKIYKLEYIENDKNYPVKLDESNNLYVNIPWTDTTYTLDSFGITATSEELNKLDGCTASVTELNYLSGVTSNIQNQLNEKSDISHAHNDIYYTENEINNLLEGKVNITGEYNELGAGYIIRDRNSNTVTTLSSLPISKSLVIANLSAATNLSVTSGMNIGDSITVICNPSANFVQAIPNTGAYKSMDGDSLNVTTGKPFEINILCYAPGLYNISCKVSK